MNSSRCVFIRSASKYPISFNMVTRRSALSRWTPLCFSGYWQASLFVYSCRTFRLLVALSVYYIWLPGSTLVLGGVKLLQPTTLDYKYPEVMSSNGVYVCVCVECGRCITGNLAEVVLLPQFSHRSSIFACHVEPVPRYKIYEVEYFVQYQGLIVNDRKLKAQRLYDSRLGHPDKAVDTWVF